MAITHPNPTADNGKAAEAGTPPAELWVPDLREWKLSVEQAERANRNLRQSATAIAAVLGIGAGSGGMLALAQAVTKAGNPLPELAVPVLIIAAAVGLGISLVLGCLAIGAFKERSRAEAKADSHLSKLIEALPQIFLPVPSKG